MNEHNFINTTVGAYIPGINFIIHFSCTLRKSEGNSLSFTQSFLAFIHSQKLIAFFISHPKSGIIN